MRTLCTAENLRPFVSQQLLYFFEWKGKRTWLLAGPMEFYVRKAHHVIDDKMVKTFDIANVNIDKSHRGHGIFTMLLEEVEALGMNVYVEQIINPRLFTFLEKRGYARYNDSMFKCQQ